MHIQPRNFDSQITERRRASSAVGGDGEASAPVAPTAADGAALALLLERSRTLAARVRVGEIEFLDAVDIAYSAAEFSNLVGRYGDASCKPRLLSRSWTFLGGRHADNERE
jgi:hypothetical protein